MVTKDTKVVSQIFINGETKDILRFGVGPSLGVVEEQLTYEAMKDSINQGQRYETQSYEGDPAYLSVNKDGIISTGRDNTPLNNLRGDTDLRVTIIKE